IWSYDGWIAVSMIAGEVVAPERLMKRIIIVGMLVIVTLYVGANLAYLYTMPVGVMAQQKEAMARPVMTAIAGPAGGVLIMLAIMTSIFGALNGNLLAKPRVAYAMARDGLTFAFLGTTHPRWATPWAAVLIQSVIAIVMVLVLSDYAALITYFVVVELAALIFAVGPVFVLRCKWAGSSLEHVVKCNVYLRDINDFAAMNEVYATFFTAPFPARTTIQVGALPGGIAVEIECIAKKARKAR